jgi:hypothetical protein
VSPSSCREPSRGGVAQRMGGDVLLDPGALRGSPDDVGEDRLLQASTGATAEDRVGRRGLRRLTLGDHERPQGRQVVEPRSNALQRAGLEPATSGL